jgi:hypothetical protein
VSRLKKLYEVWKSDCKERGIKPGRQRAFSERIAKFVNRETKNNRNTWVGIAIKDRNAAPELRVVGGDYDSAAKKGAKKGYSQCDSDGVAKTLSHLIAPLIAVSGAIFAISAITAISEEEEGLGRDFG